MIQEKGAVTPEESDPDLPVSFQESPVEIFQILKDDAVNVLHSASKFGKFSSGHRNGKGQ